MKVDLIFCADLHLRHDSPLCWDEQCSYREHQRNMMTELRRLSVKHEAPVVVAGDIFDRPQPPLELVNDVIQVLAQPMYTIPGQHDLPQHNILLQHKGAYGTLVRAGLVYDLCTTVQPADRDGLAINLVGVPYGSVVFPPEPKRRTGHRNILVCHTLLWDDRPPKGIPHPQMAERFLKDHPGYDLIVVGDNHKTFVVKGNDGRILLSPGSTMQMRADQIDHIPCAWGWDAFENQLLGIPLPKVPEGAISRDHIEAEKRRDSRIEAFVSKLKEDSEVGLSFMDNLERFLGQNKQENEIIELLREIVESV